MMNFKIFSVVAIMAVFLFVSCDADYLGDGLDDMQPDTELEMRSGCKNQLGESEDDDESSGNHDTDEGRSSGCKNQLGESEDDAEPEVDPEGMRVRLEQGVEAFQSRKIKDQLGESEDDEGRSDGCKNQLGESEDETELPLEMGG